MPRSARNLIKLDKYIKEFPTFKLSETEEKDIRFCTLCAKDIKCSDRTQITRHIHRKHTVSHPNEMIEKQLIFNKDLCNWMTSCNVVFNNVTKDKFKKLFMKHTI